MPVLRGQLARIRIVHRRGRELLEALMAYRNCRTSIDAVRERAATTVDQYGDILSDNLAQASIAGSEAETEQLRREYTRILGEFAAAVCDVIPDRDTRHALAQSMQCAILRHERRFREVATPALHVIKVRLR